MCTSRQWSPELDPEKLALQQAKVLQRIQDQKTTAAELKYATYPSTRPLDWKPVHQDIHSDEEWSHDYVDDSQPPQISQTLDHHLQQAQASGIPPVENMFGSALVESIRQRSEFLQKRKPGRPRKNEKSSSGWLAPGGVLTQQLAGSTLPKPQLSAKGPSQAALQSVTRRTGGLVDFGSLVSNNNMPGRILVSTIF